MIPVWQVESKISPKNWEYSLWFALDLTDFDHTLGQH